MFFLEKTFLFRASMEARERQMGENLSFEGGREKERGISRGCWDIRSYISKLRLEKKREAGTFLRHRGREGDGNLKSSLIIRSDKFRHTDPGFPLL